MATVMVSIGSVQGESTVSDYEGQIQCVSMRHAIDLPVVAQGAARTEGASHHGAIELVHAVDMASPLLRLAASSGTNLGTVTITHLRAIDGQIQPGEIITLGNAYVVRVGVDTPFLQGVLNEQPVETFAIEYSDIEWTSKYYAEGVGGSVQAGWSVVTQNVI